MDTTINRFRRIGKEEAKEIVRKAHEREALSLPFYALPNPKISCGMVACICGTVVLAAGGRPGELENTSFNGPRVYEGVTAPNGTHMQWSIAGAEVLGFSRYIEALDLFTGLWGNRDLDLSREENTTVKAMFDGGPVDIELVMRAMDHFIP